MVDNDDGQGEEGMLRKKGVVFGPNSVDGGRSQAVWALLGGRQGGQHNRDKVANQCCQWQQLTRSEG